MVNQDMKLKDEAKSWSDIIPSKERQKLADEEEQKKQLELYLPKRSRKTVKKVESQFFAGLVECFTDVKEVPWSLCALQWISFFIFLMMMMMIYKNVKFILKGISILRKQLYVWK